MIPVASQRPARLRVAPERQFSGWSPRGHFFGHHPRKDEQMTDVSGSGLPLETLASTIKAHIAIGDRDFAKAEQNYVSAGKHLIEAKARLEARELAGVRWLDWAAQNFPQIGGSRIEQLLRIGRGETTQAEINAARAESERRSYQPAPRFTEDMLAQMEAFNRRADEVLGGQPTPAAERDASDETSRPATAAERQQRRRSNLRSQRVEAGADLPPPLAPIEHRKLLKEGRDILGRLDFERLKAAVSVIGTTPPVEERRGLWVRVHIDYLDDEAGKIGNVEHPEVERYANELILSGLADSILDKFDAEDIRRLSVVLEIAI
jgi:hypothetical protein